MRRVGLIAVALLAGCVDFRTSVCDDLLCPSGTVCSTAHETCVLEEQIAACDGRAEGAACGYAGVSDGACRTGVCFGVGCGNGFVDPDEVCDDGNAVDGDDCSANCRSNETCGNNVIDTAVGEACDDGNLIDGDGCQSNCALPTCGDGIVDDGEVCDDGGHVADDGCNPQCTSDETCGNGVIDVVRGEQCDDGNFVAGDTCGPNCMLEYCGNDNVDPGEACDDGNIVSGDGCSANCQSDETCGNGVIDTATGEECDDGNFVSQDGCSSTCRIGGMTWEPLGTPSPRHGHAVAYDAARQRMVVFSGFNETEGLSPETWEWNGRGFVDVSPPAADSPVPRIFGTMSYDARRKRVVLFGGIAGSDANDTWEWDGSTWTDRSLSSPTAPPAVPSSMTYDAGRGRIVVFAETETWEWDGQTWSDVTPAGPSPSTRVGAAMSYDPVRGRVYLFGGADGFTRLDDMWEWDGSTWTDVTPATGPRPEPRIHSGMVYDAARGHTVLFAGYGLFAPAESYNDTWVWDGSAWTEVTPAGPSPLGRNVNRLVYDVAREQVVLFGGRDPSSTTVFDDVWTWDGAVWSEPAPQADPGPREQHAMAYDAVRGRTVTFGGVSSGTLLTDTLEWDGREWFDVTPAGASPSRRTQYALAYDPVRKRVVLFGGGDPVTRTTLADTWTWDGTTWVDVTPASSPPPRRGAELAFDTARGRLLMFGGCAIYPDPSDLLNSCGSSGTSLLADTWEWDGATWVEVTPSGTNPAQRMECAMTYDPVRDRTVMSGGNQIFITPIEESNDTWEWNGTAWTEMEVLGPNPQNRFRATLVYDGARRRPVMFGGAGSGGDDSADWDGAHWTRATAISAASIRPRSLQGIAYDGARGRTVVYGGNPREFVGDPSLGDTWQSALKATGPEACHSGLDGDQDGLVGCDDPDCWGYCTPLCPPGTTCDPAEPRCGDGACNPALESPRLCPSDCGAPPAVCGDFVCDPGEDAAGCPGDCAL